MDTDINVPKTKSVNFLFQNIKYNIYCIIFVKVAHLVISEETSHCSDEGN